MSNDYEDKKQARIDRYRELSEKASKESTALHNQAHNMASAIPFGQPILVGHHSEKRDRNYRDKIWNKTGKAVEAAEKADYYAAKAEAAESNTAISSDDPEALSKLKDRLAKLQDTQEEMKAANAYYRKHSTMKGYGDISDETAAKWDEGLKNGYSWGNQPYPSYHLQNNNANINRIKKRIAALERNQETGFVGWTFNGGEVIANAEENRLQIKFDGKPSEEQRKELKSNGFVWARSNMAWQRQLNNNALYAASRIEFIRPAGGIDPRMFQPKPPKKDAPGKGEAR